MKINNRSIPGLSNIVKFHNPKDILCFSKTFTSAMEDHLDKIYSIAYDNSFQNECVSYNGNLFILNSYVIYVEDILNDAKIFVYDLNGKNIGVIDNIIDERHWYKMRILYLLVFKKYAEIETKILPPKTESNDGIKCIYSNHSKFPITFIDSTWFTNLVKSDAFKVSGHFRLQPCHDENGKPTKKLIWINEFVKSGYTSPARKLKQ